MLKSDLENAQVFAQLMFDLTQREGDSVQIHHPNPDFDGPNCMITVTVDMTHKFDYSGDTVIHCLRQAKAEMDQLSEEISE